MAYRIVITGAGGQVGAILAEEAARRGFDVLALASSQWDITDPAAAREFVASGDVVVNCAAYTAVDAAETEPDRALAVNATGAGNVAQACAKAGARMIHISTDYVFSGVFDGTPRPYDIDDATDPLSVYGKTKLAGEQAVHAALPDAHVLRTSWVYTGVGSDFAAVMRRLAAGDEPVAWSSTRPDRRRTASTWSRRYWRSAQRGDVPPLLHVANEGAASRFEQARAVFEEVGADPERVRPVSSERHAAACGTAAVLGAVRPRRGGRGPDAAAAVARGTG